MVAVLVAVDAVGVVMGTVDVGMVVGKVAEGVIAALMAVDVAIVYVVVGVVAEAWSWPCFCLPARAELCWRRRALPSCYLCSICAPPP